MMSEGEGKWNGLVCSDGISKNSRSVVCQSKRQKQKQRTKRLSRVGISLGSFEKAGDTVHSMGLIRVYGGASGVRWLKCSLGVLLTLCWVSRHPAFAFGFLVPSWRTAVSCQRPRESESCASDDNVLVASERRRRSVVGWRRSKAKGICCGVDCASEDGSDDSLDACGSHISSVRCKNVGGMVNYSKSEGDEGIVEQGQERSGGREIEIMLGTCPSLVAVTGETGSGKSLLMSKVITYVMGSAKGSKQLVPSTGDASFAELSLTLSEPHLSETRARLTEMGLNANSFFESAEGAADATLRLRRTTERLAPSPSASSSSSSSGKKGRIRNSCQINGNDVTLKMMRAIASPLIATVDAGAAASALGKPKARIDIIDAWVPNGVIQAARLARDDYRKARETRQRLEDELSERVLPSSFAHADGDFNVDDENLELMRHWVDELDEFQARIAAFQDAVLSSSAVASLLNNYTPTIDSDQLANGPQDTSFVAALARFSSCRWAQSGSPTIPPSSFHSAFLDLRDAIKTLDAQLLAARSSCEVLSSLASPHSLRSALEQSRDLLFDATPSADQHDPVIVAAEKSHEFLNTIEEALNSAARFMEDHPQGIISTLENRRQSIGPGFSLEDIDAILADWGSLSRKHGIPPSSLPSCHHSLRQEMDGNVQARLMLPKAKHQEDAALARFQKECTLLSDARRDICNRITDAVTARLPSLGMEGSLFKVHLDSPTHSCTDHSAYTQGGILGLDAVDFFLFHGFRQQDASFSELPTEFNNSKQRGGKLDLVGSAGEKARILLAIETDFPGSVGASMSSGEGTNAQEHTDFSPPVAVVYDEIDSHIGGRAVNAVANLLSQQRGQVIAITHSPSIAARADRHVMVRKIPASDKGKVQVSVQCVDGIARTKELARMASGDVATEEAELFAGALLRYGSRRREEQPSP